MARQPTQVAGKIKMQTAKLQTSATKFIAPNPAAGSIQNQVDLLKFYFPRVSAQAGILTAANFIGNLSTDAVNAMADPDENAEIRYQYGTTLSRPKYGSIEFGTSDLLLSSSQQAANAGGGGQNQYTGIDGKTYSFPNILLPIAIISVSQPTNIVKTRITGRPGSIKEYIGSDDKTITINAVVNMNGDQAPTEFLSALQQMKDAAVSIPVTNYFLNALDIFYIVIEDINTPQEEGGYSNQAVIITACSDIPLRDFLP